MPEIDGRLLALPLVLLDVPPGLLLALGQEGVPTVAIAAPCSASLVSLHQSRFVLYDGQKSSRASIDRWVVPGQVAIDVDRYRSRYPVDPFQALLNTQAVSKVWSIAGRSVVEQVNRYDKGTIRRWLIDQVRRDVVAAGGIWARLTPFPFPFRSAFNLRIDLDESAPEDYARFAVARRPIDDCSTHFVSTAAYGGLPAVLADLRRVDTQSHGHFHHVYRDLGSNQRNLERAHAILVDAGFAPPEGFAGPHGRWNAGLDRLLEALGYRYSSDFQLGYDDRPFFPWRGDRFSEVLQIPVHPLCEGAIIAAGGDFRTVRDHLVASVRAAVDAGEPAFVYGHPEQRLGRYPQIVTALADAVVGENLVWKTTLTEFARWWRWRAALRWSLTTLEDNRWAIHFDEAEVDRTYPPAIEFVRDDQIATVPIRSPRTAVSETNLVYERRNVRYDRPQPTVVQPSRAIRATIRSAIDWETVTPLGDIARNNLTGQIKAGLRWWQSRQQMIRATDLQTPSRSHLEK